MVLVWTTQGGFRLGLLAIAARATEIGNWTVLCGVERSPCSRVNCVDSVLLAKRWLRTRLRASRRVGVRGGCPLCPMPVLTVRLTAEWELGDRLHSCRLGPFVVPREGSCPGESRTPTSPDVQIPASAYKVFFVNAVRTWLSLGAASVHGAFWEVERTGGSQALSTPAPRSTSVVPLRGVFLAWHRLCASQAHRPSRQ